jgi:hypothetical protein
MIEKIPYEKLENLNKYKDTEIPVKKREKASK